MGIEKFFPKFSTSLLIITLTLSLIVPLPAVNATLIEYTVTLNLGDALDVDTGEVNGVLAQRDLQWITSTCTRSLATLNGARFNSGVYYGYMECDASSKSYDVGSKCYAAITVGGANLFRTNTGKYAKIRVDSLSLSQITFTIVYQDDGSTNLCGGLAILGLNSPTADIPVCTEFTVEIPITNLPLSGMSNFQFELRWNPNYMEYKDHTIIDNGWTMPADSVQVDGASGILTMRTPQDANAYNRYFNDAVWLRIDFHCLGPGSSSLVTLDGYFDYYGTGDGYLFQLTETTCNQRRVIISPTSSIVGGFYTPVNSFAVLLPYLALISLLGVVATILIAKKTRNKA